MRHSLIRARTDKEPIKVRWYRHSEELVGALEQARSRKSSAGDQKLITPPLELAELSTTLVAKTAQWDHAAWFGEKRNTRSVQRSR